MLGESYSEINTFRTLYSATAKILCRIFSPVLTNSLIKRPVTV
jgi:hypothetical protein